MFCTNCGQELPDDATVCTNCGVIPCIPTESDNNDTITNSPEYYGQTYSYVNDQLENDPQQSSKVLTKYDAPLSTANFFLTQVLFLIPVVNLFFILFWSFKKNVNQNRKAYARSKLIWSIIITVIIIFTILTLVFMEYAISFNVFLRLLKNYLNSITYI